MSQGTRVRIGQLDKRVRLERFTATASKMGTQVKAWTAIGSRRANVSYGTGEERRRAAQTGASVSATFRMRSDPTTRSLTPRDRLQFDDAEWDIVSAVPFGRRRFVDVTATRAA